MPNAPSIICAIKTTRTNTRILTSMKMRPSQLRFQLSRLCHVRESRSGRTHGCSTRAITPFTSILLLKGKDGRAAAFLWLEQTFEILFCSFVFRVREYLFCGAGFNDLAQVHVDHIIRKAFCLP